MPRIFISYRRDDSGYVAAILHERLRARFGADSVFFDIDTVPIGADFREHITNAIGQCNVLLVLIGNSWLEARDPNGSKRLDAPTDYVRIEIEAALKRGIPVIPVLVDKAAVPPEAELPPSIQSLVYRQAAEVRAGADFSNHLERLIQGLTRLAGEEVRPTPTQLKALQSIPTKPAGPITPTRMKQPSEATSTARTANASPPSLARTDAPIQRRKRQRPHPQPTTKIAKREDRVVKPRADPRRPADPVSLDDVEKYLGVEGQRKYKFSWTNLYGTGVPIEEDKLRKAMDSYAPNVNEDDVMVLYDHTAYGSATYGFIVTSKAIFWKNLFSEPQSKRYTDITTVNIANYGKGILIDGDTVEMRQDLARPVVSLIQHALGRVPDEPDEKPSQKWSILEWLAGRRDRSESS